MPPESTSFQHILAEHHQLNQLLARLQAALSTNDPRRAEILQWFDQLIAYVRDHFAHEENDGFFEQVADRAPRLKYEADLLKREHVEMLADLTQIDGRLHEDPSVDGLRKAGADLRAFMHRFAEHEEGEDQILQEAFDRDVGSMD